MKRAVCIGAGPAGLTAAYLLSRSGVQVTVLECDPDYVGGISRTVKYKGFGFDIGGHRFFSKSEEVERLWDELLEEPLLERPRKSRIYYRGKFFDYPLRPLDALSKLGLVEAFLCVLSYLRARLWPFKAPSNFEQWVTNQFGHRLFTIFFKTYTEKVWGMHCSEISADWAAQRIKDLSLFQAIWRSFLPQRGQSTPRGAMIKTLVDRFRYPRLGPGMLWESATAKICRSGGRVLLGRRVVSLQKLDGTSGRWEVRAVGLHGDIEVFPCEHVISSMPMRELAQALRPAVAPVVTAAAERLRYRDFLVVSLIVRDKGLFDDNWIYIHEPGVKVGRIQNFKSWSPDLVPDPALNCYGMEYFCFEGDGLWSSSDDDLVSLASRELVSLGLANADDIIDGTVVRQSKAYPVYDACYEANVAVLRREIETRYAGLYPVGRNGMHKYNNQDHAMMTAILTARNIIFGNQKYDVWQVNQDAEYHEALQEKALQF